MSIEQLKKTLKDWEHAFQALHHRKPSKEDIKAEPSIEAKYREYKTVRYGKPRSHHSHGHRDSHSHSHRHGHGHNDNSHRTSERSSNRAIFQTGIALHTPAKSSPDKFGPSDLVSPSKQVQELGPTPQLNGRLLGIFGEAHGSQHQQQTTTPVKTPTKTPTKDIEDSPSGGRIVITPSVKRRIDFSEIHSDNEEEENTGSGRIRTSTSSSIITSTPPLKIQKSSSRLNILNSKTKIQNNDSSKFVQPTRATKLNLDKYSTPTHDRIMHTVFKTPTKTPTSHLLLSPSKTNVEKTPMYLRQGTTAMLVEPQASVASPSGGSAEADTFEENNISLISPLVFKYESRLSFGRKSRGIRRKTLSQIFSEVQEIKKDLSEDGKMRMEIATELEEQQFIQEIQREDMEKNGVLDDNDRFDIVGEMGRATNEFESELVEDIVESEQAKLAGDDHKTAYWLKKKRPKRQTRRVKMKGRGTTEEATIVDEEEIEENIELLKSKQLNEEKKEINNDENNQVKDESNVSFEEYVQASDEEEENNNDSDITLLEKLRAHSKTTTGESTVANGGSFKKQQKLISNNFKKYKLQKGNFKGRFRRR